MALDPDKIRERREAIDLTQAEAAALAAMSQQSWARIETGKRVDPALSTAIRMADALRCPLDRLTAR